jgi:hypothetical protein
LSLSLSLSTYPYLSVCRCVCVSLSLSASLSYSLSDCGPRGWCAARWSCRQNPKMQVSSISQSAKVQLNHFFPRNYNFKWLRFFPFLQTFEFLAQYSERPGIKGLEFGLARHEAHPRLYLRFSFLHFILNVFRCIS